MAHGLLCMAPRHPSNSANKYPVTYLQRPLADNYIWLIYILSVSNPNEFSTSSPWAICCLTSFYLPSLLCKFSSFNLQNNAVRFGSGLSYFSAHLHWVIPCRLKPYLQISILHLYRSGSHSAVREPDPSLTQSLFSLQRIRLNSAPTSIQGILVTSLVC